MALSFPSHFYPENFPSSKLPQANKPSKFLTYKLEENGSSSCLDNHWTHPLVGLLNCCSQVLNTPGKPLPLKGI